MRKIAKITIIISIFFNLFLFWIYFWALTDKIQNPTYICQRLLKTKEDYTVYVGENLSYDDEKITKGRPLELQNQTWRNLSVVVVEHDKKIK